MITRVFSLRALALCLALGAIFGAGAAWYVQGLKIDALRADFDGFRGIVKAEGEAATRAAAIKEARDKTIKDESDRTYETAIATLTADNKRLRDARTRGGYVPAGPEAAGSSNLACFDRTELNAALRRFDDGLSGLIEEGDKNAIGLNVARRWAAGIGSHNPATIPP